MLRPNQSLLAKESGILNSTTTYLKYGKSAELEQADGTSRRRFRRGFVDELRSV